VTRRSAAFAMAFLGAAWSGVACSSLYPSYVGGDSSTDVEARDSGADAPGDLEAAGDSRPSLIALGVTTADPSDASPPLTLVPAFSPEIHDYYVRCTAGTNALTISMTASPGSTSQLIQPIASTTLPDQTLPVSVEENQAIVATASDETSSVEYWVRCLPYDFPHMAMTRYPEAGTPPAGYYLIGNAWLGGSEVAGYAMVLDGNGVPVWYFRQPGLGVFDVDDVVIGAITFRASFNDITFREDEPFEIHALSPPGTTRIEPTGFQADEHELRLLANGNFLVLSYPLKTGVDLTGLSLPLADGGGQPLGPSSVIQDCVIVEFQPAGTVVSTWAASDHFDPAVDTRVAATAFGYGSSGGPDGGTVYDVFHCNSIDVDPSNGNLLVSARQMDSIFYVDRPTGRVLWKMGGAPQTMDDATYVTATDPFFEQHDARLLPGWSPTCRGGAGQVSLFDDESQELGPARGVVYDVVVGAGDGGTGAESGCGDGRAAGAATVAWQYKGSATSSAAGSFRILPDGSRVIGWGFGNGLEVFTEIDVAGTELLHFEFTDGNSSYRAIKVPLSALDLGAMRNTAGLP
jgi:arylsulfotransferase ASST